MFLLATLTSMAQDNVSGIVVAEGSKEPLTGASVILRNAEGKIITLWKRAADLNKLYSYVYILL